MRRKANQMLRMIRKFFVRLDVTLTLRHFTSATFGVYGPSVIINSKR